MKLVIFTSNGIRHKYVANTLTKFVDDILIVSECRQNDASDKETEGNLSPIDEHFRKRYLTEKVMFAGNDVFKGNVLPLVYKEANLEYTYQVVKEFDPDLMIVFGSSIIKEPLLSLKPNRFVNLHLGLSPYYRGSGTNFWPFVNKELEYVGSTILHLDSGIDTGDILTHVKPNFEINDDVHTVGCKVIQESVNVLKKIIEMVKKNTELNRIKQWELSDSKYYKNSDFNEEILNLYKKNLSEGLIKKFLEKSENKIRIINIDNDKNETDRN
jgi:methionyl-tRNA formyltransferase